MAAHDPVSDPARTDEMVNTEPKAVLDAVEEQRRGAGRAWLLWALLGSLGAHRLYLRRGVGATPVAGGSLALSLVSMAVGRRKLAAGFGAAWFVAWLYEGFALRGLLRDLEREAARETVAEFAEDRIQREVAGS
jgi:hypothetical protein